MTREIKFRGKRLDNGEWVYGYYSSANFGEGVGRKHVIQTSDNDDFSYHFVDPKTVGQYTGLKDVNGTEIYEGSIIRDVYEEKAIKEVIWRRNGFQAKYNFQKSYMGEKYTETNYLELRETDSRRWGVEVVGDVYDNPELLLKGGNNNE